MAYVYWFEGGRVLHCQAECPRLLAALRGRRRRLLSCDMDAADSEGRQSYPPDDLPLCRICVSAGRPVMA